MLDFKKVELCDKRAVERLLDISDVGGCTNSFGTMFCWGEMYNIRTAIVGDCLFRLSGLPNKEAYSFPAGNFDTKAAIETLLRDAEERGIDFRIYGVTNEQKQMLCDEFGDIFDFEPDRDFFDYVYLKSDLENLAGKRYHAKRNHIAHFDAAYNWHYEEVSEANLDACKEVWHKWCAEKNCEADGDLIKESCALSRAINNFTALGLCGGIIFAEDTPVAFCLGERQKSDTFITHYEKALSGYAGAYALINREFAKNTVGDFKYINREEDTGDPGLRKAKLSYHPAFLLEKYNVTLRG